MRMFIADLFGVNGKPTYEPIFKRGFAYKNSTKFPLKAYTLMHMTCDTYPRNKIQKIYSHEWVDIVLKNFTRI